MPTIFPSNPGMSYTSGTVVSITCALSGGNPLANLIFKCTGKSLEGFNQTNSTTAISVLNFTIDGSFNNRTCTCIGKHLALNNSDIQNSITLAVNGMYRGCDLI